MYHQLPGGGSEDPESECLQEKTEEGTVTETLIMICQFSVYINNCI